jgi:hypothetical protein
MMPLAEIGADNAGTTRHVYPTAAMLSDYLRAAAGLVPAAIVFAVEPVGPVAATVLGGFAAVFGVFGLRTLLRHGTSIEMTDGELRAYGVLPRTLAWAELDRMKLAYYSTRRDKRSGWMQLELRAGAVRLKLDSRIDGFDRVVWRAAEAAHERGIAINDATMANLQALGIRLFELEAPR